MDSRALVGSIGLVLAVAPVVVGAATVRRRVLGTWTGPPAVLATALLAITAVFGVVEVLGILGQLRVVALVPALAAVGAAATLGGRRLAQRDAPFAPAPAGMGPRADLALVGVLALVAATWGARTFTALRHGITTIDSLWYHLPSAARYARSGSIGEITHDFEGISGFYPNGNDLVHAFGMVVLDNDLLSVFVDAGWGALALLAAWCIGRPYGVPQATTAGLGVLLCAPAFVASQPGGAYADITGVALALSAVAVLLTAGERRFVPDPAALVVAATAVGLCFATKWTFLPFAGALTVSVAVLAVRAGRWRAAVAWAGTVVVVGCYSYVRNWVEVGNPMPLMEVGLGPIRFERAAELPVGTEALSAVITDRDAWRDYLIPGFDRWWGVGWWAALGFVAAGIALAVLRARGTVVRVAGACAALAAAGYVVTPQMLLLLGQPYFFWANLRYVAVAVAFGLVLLPVATGLEGRRAWVPLGGALWLVVLAQFDPTLWPSELRELRVEGPVLGVDAWSGAVSGAAALVLGLAGRRWLPPLRERLGTNAPGRAWSAAGATAATVLVVAGTTFAQGWFLDHRYALPEEPTPLLPVHYRSWTFARDLEDKRIAFRNSNLVYPLYGNALTNVVERIGGPDTVVAGNPGPSPELTTCAEWREAVNEGRYDFVVLYGLLLGSGETAPGSVGRPLSEVLPEVAWLDADPAARVLLDDPGDVVIAIGGELDPSTCPP